MKREQFEEVLVAGGWEKDRFGHYQKTERKRIPHVDHPDGIIRMSRYRVKLQKLSCRFEVQTVFFSY